MSVPDAEVLAAAEALGETLHTIKSESTASAFESLLIDCNEAVTAEIGLEYGEVCDREDDCC